MIFMSISADIGSIGEIDIVNEIVDLVDFYAPPGEDIDLILC